MLINYASTTETTSIKKQPTPPIKSSIANSVQLGWILVNKKTISQIQLESALTFQSCHGQKIGELLVEQQLISREELEQALKEQYWRRNGYWVI